MVVINMLEKVTKALDNKLSAIEVFIDLSKAFNTVDHQISSRKLKHYEIRGIALNWYRSYLSNRYQNVAIDDIESTSQRVTCGVPQDQYLDRFCFISI